MVRLRWKMILFAVVVAAGLGMQGAGAAEKVPLMTVEELNGALGSSDFMILDVRQGRDWDDGAVKIKGAVRRDPADFKTWKDGLPRDKTLVLYCA